MSPTILSRFALLFVTAMLSAQQAAPTTETDNAVWSAEEANQLYYLRANFDNLRQSAQPVQYGGRAVKNALYWLAFFTKDEAGDAMLAQSIGKQQPAFAIAWPSTIGPGSQRGILMHSDGTTLFCEPGAEDLAKLTADLVLAKGGAGKFDDALRQPGTGNKGHLWLWLSQTGFQAKVQVVDDKGKPRGDITVDVCVEGPATRAGTVVQLPQPLPLARGKTNASGFAVLQGPRCLQTVALLHAATLAIIGSRVTVEDTGTSIRFVVPDAAMVNVALAANERAAIGTLKNISSSQAQCQASAVIDADRNGAGEYGFFGELSGAVAVRSDGKGGVGKQTFQPPVLSNAFAKVASSRVQRSGYVFQIFLPDSKGTATAEAATGGGAGVSIDPKKAEVMWCCYAWPESPTSGLRAFFINQNGDVLACMNDDGRYCGTDKLPAPDAAFAADTTGTMDSKLAANSKGRDGQTWTVVN